MHRDWERLAEACFDAFVRRPIDGDRRTVYAEQRGLERMLYDRYPEARAANGGYNFIRGISLSNPNLDSYMQSASDFLARLGGS